MTNPERGVGRIDKLLTPRERKPVLTLELAEQARVFTKDLPDDFLVSPLGVPLGVPSKERPEVWGAYLSSLLPITRSVVTRAVKVSERAIKVYSEGYSEGSWFSHRKSLSNIAVGDFRRLAEMIEEGGKEISIYFNSPSIGFIAAAFHRPGIEETWPKRERHVYERPSFTYHDKDKDSEPEESLEEIGKALKAALAEIDDEN
jgi:hypothetical protein